MLDEDRKSLQDCRGSKKDAAKTMTEAKEDDTEIHTFAFTLQETRDRRRRHQEDSSLLVDTGSTSHIITNRTKFVSFDNDFDTNTHTKELADGNKTNVIKLCKG